MAEVNKKFIDHLSYSAVRSFLTSPYKFWSSYVAKQPFKPNLPMLMGSAWHKGLENYLSGNLKNTLIAANDYITKNVDEVRETISKDKLEEFEKKLAKELHDLADNLEAYHSYTGSERTWKPSEHIEKYTRAMAPVEGSLPISGMIDVIDADGNPIDHKYVGRFSTGGTEKYQVQAWFYYYLTKEVTGEYPQYFRISEFKKVKNRDGSPQLKDLIIIYKSEWIEKVDRWYLEVCEQILGQKHFIPNPFQMFGCEDWKEYLRD